MTPQARDHLYHGHILGYIVAVTARVEIKIDVKILRSFFCYLASILRRVYLRGGVGVGALTKVYGGS